MSYIEAPTRRLIITVEGGFVTSLTCEGVDLSGVTAFLIDFDNKDDAEAVDIDGAQCSLGEIAIEQEGDHYSSEFRRAYGNWIAGNGE